MKKKFLNKKNIMIMSGVGAGIVLSAMAAGFWVSCSNSKRNDFIIEKEYKKFDYSSSDIYNRNLLNFHDRKLNKLPAYETELNKLYKDQGFKYPAYNHSYKENEEANRYLKLADGTTIDLGVKLHEEVVLLKNEKGQPILDDTGQQQFLKYRDPKFIIQEIKNGTFTKHPWADDAYLNGVTSQTKAVDADFVIGSGLIGWTSLGLYAPAGEIIEIQFTDETYDALMREPNKSKFDIYINEGYWDQDQGFNGAQQPPEEFLKKNKIGVRMPFMQSIFSLKGSDIDPKTKSFKFGTPYGGSISLKINDRIKSPKSNDLYDAYMPLKFKVKEAIESFHYVHGQTTLNDWNNMIEKVKNREITAPIFSAYFTFASIHIPFTNKKLDEIEIGHSNINSLIYPKEVFDKFYDFLFLSQYTYRNDQLGTGQRESFKFSDDVWGGAGAWGGTWHLFSPAEWGSKTFLLGTKYFNAYDSWGTLHEINHAWQQNEALFAKRTHPETNAVTMTNLSLLNDSGKDRSPFNIYYDFVGDNKLSASKVISPFGITETVINTPNSSRENDDIYALLLYNWGTYRYLDYVRWDVANHPNNAPNWNGFKEIIAMSDYHKINYWPVFYNYGNKYGWVDSWPTSQNPPTTEQTKEIERLANAYPATDFVSNLYATGSYFYNSQTKKFEYTNDVAPAYQIPAATEYIFDFGNFIKSVNPDFSWDKIEISETKTNSKLIKDEKDPKKFKYIPDKNKLTEIDEFIVTIHPSNFKNKPKNYVPAYKWKIKVRQVTNLPTYSIYNHKWEGLGWQDGPADNPPFDEIDKLTPIYQNVQTRSMDVNFSTFYLNGKGNWPIRQQFKYVVPKDGKYTFRFNHPDSMSELKVLNKGIRITNKKGQNEASIELKKDEILDIDIKAFSSIDNRRYRIFYDLIYNDVYPLDVADSSLLYNIDELVKKINYKGDVRDFAKKDEYKYQKRRLNYFDFPISSKFINNDPIDPKYINNRRYRLKNTTQGYDPNNIAHDPNQLKNKNQRFEVWNGNFYPGYGKEPAPGKHKLARVNFELEFLDENNNINPTKVGFIGLWKGRYKENLATSGKIIGYDENDQQIVLHEGKIEKLKNGEFQYIDVTTPKLLKKIEFNLINEIDSVEGSGISYQYIELSENRYKNLSNAYSTSNPLISSKDWEQKINEGDFFVSPFNNTTMISRKKNSVMEFELESEGFRIIGNKTLVEGLFDVYIDGKLFQSDISTKSNNIETNVTLFQYSTIKKERFKVKIVAKSANPLYFAYIDTFGYNTKLI